LSLLSAPGLSAAGLQALKIKQNASKRQPTVKVCFTNRNRFIMLSLIRKKFFTASSHHARPQVRRQLAQRPRRRRLKQGDGIQCGPYKAKNRTRAGRHILMLF